MHLFAGAGGGILGDILLGHQCVCAVEINPYCQQVLAARQKDGCLPWFPVFADVQQFDGRPWAGIVDVVSGGFPCQDISCAGKGAGIDGERSGMWVEMARIIGEVRPRFALVENSPILTSRGLGRVLGDLAALGYDARWGVLGAVDAGAPHKRERIWIVADAAGERIDGERGNDTSTRSEGHEGEQEPDAGSEGNVAYAQHARLEGHNQQVVNQSGGGGSSTNSGEGGPLVAYATSTGQSGPRPHWFSCDPSEAREGETDHAFAERIGHIWGIESPVGRVAHGVAARVDRLKAIGNGQVPAVVRLAWETLTNTEENT